MDTQYSTGMADGVSQLDIYSAPSLDDADLDDRVQQVRHGRHRPGRKGSASFGECELSPRPTARWPPGIRSSRRPQVQGQTVFASAGRYGWLLPGRYRGANGVLLRARLDVTYPASSPWVVSGRRHHAADELRRPRRRRDRPARRRRRPGACSSRSSRGRAPSSATRSASRSPTWRWTPTPTAWANAYVAGAPEGVGVRASRHPLTLGVWARLESAHANGLGFARPLPLRAIGIGSDLHDIILRWRTLAVPGGPGVRPGDGTSARSTCRGDERPRRRLRSRNRRGPRRGRAPGTHRRLLHGHDPDRADVGVLRQEQGLDRPCRARLGSHPGDARRGLSVSNVSKIP